MKGILFKPWKIQFIAEHPDMEIQTRRVIKPQPPSKYHSPIQIIGTAAWGFQKPSCADLPFLVKPRYQVGEIVYIKEAFEIIDDYGDTAIIHFPATDEQLLLSGLGITHKHWLTDRYGKMISPLFMPEWAARYFIKITDVRAERLQEISEDDAKAEGTEYTEWWIPNVGLDGKDNLRAFYYLWNSTNPKYPWESNPWVWVYTFEVIAQNSDKRASGFAICQSQREPEFSPKEA